MSNDNGSAPRFIPARPTVVVAGKAEDALTQQLLNLTIVENTHGLYRCEATFVNWGASDTGIGFLYFDQRKLDFGKSFTVKLGTDTMFDGRITALEGHFPTGRPPELCVLAEDRFQDLRMTRRTRSYFDVSDSDVMNQIAGDHGLRTNVDISGPKHKVLAQVNQSDMAFIRERARAVDVELWMDGGTLNAQTHSKRNGDSLKMNYQLELREFSVVADLAGQRTSISVTGWDVSGKSALKYSADQSAISSELRGGRSGPEILQSALGQCRDALVNTIPLTSQETQATAESFFRMAARRFVVGHGIAEPNSHLRVGCSVDLQQLGPLFSGKYYVVEVRHLFDGNEGLRTEFTVERPGLGQGQP
jgi:phage protein D